MAFYDRYVSLCKEIGKYPQSPEMLEAAGVKSPSVTNWKKKNTVPKADVLSRLALFFGVSVEYLLDQTDVRNGSTASGDDELKVALFGGDAEVTDEMWDEVKQFAAFVKARRAAEMKKAPEGGEKE